MASGSTLNCEDLNIAGLLSFGLFGLFLVSKNGQKNQGNLKWEIKYVSYIGFPSFKKFFWKMAELSCRAQLISLVSERYIGEAQVVKWLMLP